MLFVSGSRVMWVIGCTWSIDTQAGAQPNTARRTKIGFLIQLALSGRGMSGKTIAVDENNPNLL
jgi:hypothetical protein